MRDKVLNIVLNLFKVKSLVTFVTVYVFFYLVRNGEIEPATTTAIIMLVFNNLFDKRKDEKK